MIKTVIQSKNSGVIMFDRDLNQLGNFPAVLWETWSREVSKIYPKGIEALTFSSIEQIEFIPLSITTSKNLELTTFPHACKPFHQRPIVHDGKTINLVQVHNAGATIIQEVIYGLQSFNQLDNNTNDIEIHVCTDSLFFANIAKLRALRFCLEKLNEAMGGELQFKIYAHGSLREQTIFDPWVNLLRSTATVASAILGGADFVSSPTYDHLAMLCLNKETDWKTIRQAENTIKILLEESQLAQVKDVAKGSYSIENLTEQIIKKAWHEFVQKADHFFANEADFAREIELVAQKRYDLVRQRKTSITGINNFANPDESLLSLYHQNFNIYFRPEGLYPLRPLSLEFEVLRAKYDKANEKIQIAVLTDASKLSARINFVQNYFEIIGVKTQTIMGILSKFKSLR
jgi:methylmalonyl-CoA mutase